MLRGRLLGNHYDFHCYYEIIYYITKSHYITKSFITKTVIYYEDCYYQRWSPRGRPWPRGRPRGQILKSLALASKVKSLALASRPEVLENWPVLGSRTARFFGMLKFCGALEKFFGKGFLVKTA